MFKRNYIKYDERYFYYKLEEYIFLFHNYNNNNFIEHFVWLSWRSISDETLYWFLITPENYENINSELLLNDFFDNIIGSDLINRSEYSKSMIEYPKVNNIFKALIRKEKITKLFSK